MANANGLMRQPMPGIRYYYTSLLSPEFQGIQEKLGGFSYAVFRWSFDLDKCSFVEGVTAHLVAGFIEEVEAAKFCDFRNYWTQKNNDTDPSKITVPDIQPAKIVL